MILPPNRNLLDVKLSAEYGHLEERGFGASIEADFIVGSQVRLHRATNACPQAYFGPHKQVFRDFGRSQATVCSRSWKTRRRNLSLGLAMVIRPAALAWRLAD